MAAHCLSVCGPCSEICTVCQSSYDEYVRREVEAKTNGAKRWLEYLGYTVTHPDLEEDK
jgi:hypothetical protein